MADDSTTTAAPRAISPRAGLRNAALFTLGFIGLYVLIGVYVQRLVGGNESGGSGAAAGVVGPEAGREIFWGKGKCSTCHSVGGEGSAQRCPNLEGVAATAATRDAAKYKTATEYLVASIADPAAYVVEGFDGGTMPKVYLPPISLAPDEIRSVIAYLQTQGGEADLEAIVLPPEVEAAAAAGGGPGAAWAPYLKGDPANGEKLFTSGRDGKNTIGQAPACGTCHTFKGKGGTVGPPLDDIAGTRGQAYVIESILDPAAEVVAGFPPAMPPVFATELTVNELHDILAYLSQ